MKAFGSVRFSPCSEVEIFGKNGFQCTEGMLRKLAKGKLRAFYDCTLS